MSPRWSQRLTRRNIAAVTVALLVLVLTGVLEHLYQANFGDDAWSSGFDNVDVRVGEAVDVDGMRATVLGYETAYRIKTTSTRDPVVANGIFVIVRLRGENVGTGNNDMAETHLNTGDALIEYVGGRPPQPAQGFRQVSTVYFDVEPALLTGARITIAQKEVTYRYRTRAVIDLGIDEARAAELRGVPPEHLVTPEDDHLEAIP